MSLPDHVDVFIAGAGTAGAALAMHAARRGMRVLCIDRGALNGAGARWINGVTRQAFLDADVGLPTSPELRHDDSATFHLVAGHGPRRVCLSDHGVLDVDMRHLVARLQRQATEAGAALIGGVTLQGLEGSRAHTSRGTVQAEYVVDATGATGARLLSQPKTGARNLCTAAQYVFRLKDAAAAVHFFAEHGAAPGETLCFSGIAGGYSILNLKLHGDELDILTGSIPGLGHLSGRRLVDDFVKTHDWVGERCFGGQRTIPLGRPHDELARGRVALLGDAARQVFSAHGSGIGVGMIAARTLADELAQGAGPEGYAVAWQRRHGGTLAAYDQFRRFSQGLDVVALERMMDTGLLDATMVGAGLVQELPALALGELPVRVKSLVDAPALSVALGAVLGRMGALMASYAAYPAGDRSRWRRLTARIAAET